MVSKKLDTVPNELYTESIMVVVNSGQKCDGILRKQVAYNSGKPGKPRNLREFVNSGELRENS